MGQTERLRPFPDDVVELGRALGRDGLRGRHRTQSELARAVNVSSSTLSRWELGERLMSSREAVLLDRYFGTGTRIQEAVARLRDGAGRAGLSTTASHQWPAEYAGSVWVQLTPTEGTGPLVVTLDWGPWQCRREWTTESARIVLLTGKAADRDGAVPLTLSASRAVGVLFGTGTPGEGPVIDIRRDWYRP